MQTATNALSDLCDVQKLFMQCLEGYPSNITHAGFADYKGNIVMVSLISVAVVTEDSRPLGVAVQLVERNNAPCGVQLVNPNAVNKSADPTDLVSLAQQVQKVISFAV